MFPSGTPGLKGFLWDTGVRKSVLAVPWAELVHQPLARSVLLIQLGSTLCTPTLRVSSFLGSSCWLWLFLTDCVRFEVGWTDMRSDKGNERRDAEGRTWGGPCTPPNCPPLRLSPPPSPARAVPVITPAPSPGLWVGICPLGLERRNEIGNPTQKEILVSKCTTPAYIWVRSPWKIRILSIQFTVHWTPVCTLKMILQVSFCTIYMWMSRW